MTSPFLQIPESDWVARNELAFAIRDRFPVSPGHTLVITRRLAADWWSATTAEQHALIELVGEVKATLDASMRPSGYNVGFNAGAAAGQTVPHLHVHVIPRFDGDMPDPRGGVRHVIPSKGNYLAPATHGLPLVTPVDGRMKLELLRCLINDSYDRIDLVVSFVMRSGLNLVARHLDDALGRGAHVRLLTTDYLGITDASALGFFLDRLDSPIDIAGSLSVRVFSDASTSFHPKAYIFSNSQTGTGVAFVGSSNLSRSGLEHGIEWNIETRDVHGLVREFDQLWHDRRSIVLSSPWLVDYQARRQVPTPIAPGQEPVGDEEPEPPPAPRGVQSDALDALSATRSAGFGAGLVVMATGLGKTWLAAFDATRPSFRRVLFVAHRDEILTQARDVFRRIRPDGNLTMFNGSERDLTGDVVFASIQSLSRHLARIDPTTFDYIVVDEFHHADAPSYRKTIGHFRPQFLLGLTATPERTDRADLLALCSDNLVYECDLIEGIQRELLSPFAYRAIRDVADYEHIPWRSGRFDIDALEVQLETGARAQQVYDEWVGLGGSSRRTLGFCCTIRHADFMARFFSDLGVRAVAVHSGSASAQRQRSLDLLSAGELDVIFTVDLFNEGVDVPAVDAVLMLRPTESPVVFFQQLGRGLRVHTGKQRLEVLDLVGNHKAFLLKARLLAALAGTAGATTTEALRIIAGDMTDLPNGCSLIVDTEVVALLRELAKRETRESRTITLLRDWVAEHDGRRPSALELALRSPEPLADRKADGWYGLLRRLGLLTPIEATVVDMAGEFLLDIEFGAYTKSFKLVTLQAMLNADSLRPGMGLNELALGSRWIVMRDRRLRNDLGDARRSFADPASPSEREWSNYWRKNPINAWVGGNTASDEAWFELVDDHLQLRLTIPDDLGLTFDAMVQELVDYRLHRYLLTKKRLDAGERQVVRGPDGTPIDAEFTVEALGDRVTVIIESAGGKAGSAEARNTDYVQGVDLVLERLARIGARLVDVYVDSTRTASMPVEERRLSPGEGLDYPIELKGRDLGAVRRALLRSMTRVGRGEGATGGGNPRKRFRLVLDNVPDDAQTLADEVASDIERPKTAEAQPLSLA